MKKILLLLIFLVGCQPMNSTWTTVPNEQEVIEQAALRMAQRRIIEHDLGIKPPAYQNCPHSYDQRVIDISSPDAYEREATGVGAVRNLWPW